MQPDKQHEPCYRAPQSTKVAIYTDVTYTDASAALAALADTYGIATSYWSAD